MPQRWPLVGRDDEIAAVMASVNERDGRGVVLAGKVGVGKSRLGREAVQRVESLGWSTRTLAATATSRTVPLGACAPWTDDAGGTPAALVRRVGESLVEGTEPGRVLLLVDDAHLLDDLSVLVVRHLVDSGGAKVVMTIRSGEPVPAALSALWRDGQIAWHEVEALSSDRVSAVLAAAFGATPDRRCSDRFWRLAQGNMLFVRQLADQEAGAGRLAATNGELRWDGEVAIRGSLADLVETQVGALREPVLDVIDVIAVAEPVEWRCLSALVDQDAVEEAEQRGLIRIVGEAVFVDHPLFAEIRRARCGTARLRRLRGQVAMAMGDSRSPAALVKRGLLWLDSDLPARPDLLLAAATAASALLDFDLAEKLFAASAEAGVGPRAHVSRAWSLFMMGDGDTADEALHQVPAQQRAVGSGFRNDVVLQASNALWAKRKPEEAWQIVEEALQIETGERRQQLLVFRANQLALAGRTTEVLETLEQIDDRELDAYGTVMVCIATCMAYSELAQPDRVAAAVAVSERALEQTVDGAHLHGPIAEMYTSALAASGHISHALEVAEQFASSRHGQAAALRDVAGQILGMAHLAAGDLRTALDHLPIGLDPSCWVGRGFHSANSLPRFQLMRAQALARLGDVESATQALESARELRQPAYRFYDSAELIAEAWIAAAGSQFRDARELTLAAAAFARDHQQWAREVWCLQMAVELDDTDAGERLTELAQQVGTVRARAAAGYAAALNSDDAAGLDAASKILESMGDRLAAADAAAQAATSHRRAGNTSSAKTAAARARRLAALCGGATSPAIATADLTPPFSSREREIVVLVAQGLSNREIAKVQSLSVRTVESHIYRASSKAGVAGRAGLRSLVSE